MIQRPSKPRAAQAAAIVPPNAVDARSEQLARAVAPLPLPAFDALFQALRVKGVVYWAHDFAAPWAMRFLQTAHARFHVVLRGRCWIRIDGQVVALRTNDLVLLLPDAAEHVLAEGDACLADDAPDAREVGARMRSGAFELAGEPTVRIMSGHFEFDGPTRDLLLRSLPAVIRTRARTGANRALVRALPALMASELRGPRRPGAMVIVERLAEIFLVQVLRAHFAQAASAPPAEATRRSLMAAFFDSRLNAGLDFMHARGHEPLTLARVASAAGLSRSAFAQRFKAVTGEMPMAYLAEWRLLRATGLLAASQASVAQVAADCGHRSTEGFSRAFKRRYGVSPAQWRSRARETT